MSTNKILLIDHYDSFTFNLVQYFEELGASVKVVQFDRVTLSQIKKIKFSKIVLSPGPGHPKDTGVTREILHESSIQVPTLGVCLGHQVMGLEFGGKVRLARQMMHGKVSTIEHDGQGIFFGISKRTSVARYHSLSVEIGNRSSELEVCARSIEKKPEIMAIRHKKLPFVGVQFHPESIVTPEGKKMLHNFLKGRIH